MARKSDLPNKSVADLHKCTAWFKSAIVGLVSLMSPRIRFAPCSYTASLAGCAAQLIPRKAQDFLLPLAARLVAAEPRFRLLFFGQGRTRRTLERRAARLGLGDTVRFAGFLPEWPLLLPGLDLLLHPARREGLGSVLLEAMSAGVAVVAAAAGGIVDVIDDGRSGVLQLQLKYGPRGERLINSIDRFSKPGCRRFARVDDLPRPLQGLGVAIVSTSRGVLSDRSCREHRVGGEVVAIVT